MITKTQPDLLDNWILRLSNQEMPAFAHTARSVAYVSREDESSANDLANVILHDSAMTARILRLANSVVHNASGRSIETVSYAIVVLGFEQVRNMALTISMIDTVLHSEHQKIVQREMICAYHAAIQAQRLVGEDAPPEKLEAVYIAALLHRLGPIMFWCFPFGKADALLDAYAELRPEIAERSVLGFTLKQLTSGLVTEWQLSHLLDKTLKGTASVKDSSSIALGLAVSDAILKGWESIEFSRELENVASHLKLSIKDAREYIYEGARLANEGLVSFGFPQTGVLLPPDEESLPPEPAGGPENLQLELRILRQLTHMLGEQLDMNRVVMAVLEGVYRVLDMKNVMFAVVDHQHRSLKPKLMLGEKRETMMNRVEVPRGTEEYFSYLREVGEVVWKKPRDQSRIPVDPTIRSLGADEYLLAPVVVNERLLGLVYADRGSRGTPLTEANRDSFVHLSDHVVVAFQILATRKS